MTNRRLFSPVPYWRYFKLPADRALDRSMVEIKKAVDDLHRARRGSGSPRSPELREEPRELPREAWSPPRRRHLQRRGHHRQRLHPAARRRGHHLALDGVDDLVDGQAPGDPGALGRGGRRGPRRAAVPDRVRDGRGLRLRRGGAARVDAADAGRPGHRASSRSPTPRSEASTSPPAPACCCCTGCAGLRDVERAGEFDPGALAGGRTGSSRPTRSRSSPSAPGRASAPAATSPSSRRRPR